MTDQEHKNRILKATEALNKAQDAAREDGLQVEIRRGRYQGANGAMRNAEFLLDPMVYRVL